MTKDELIDLARFVAKKYNLVPTLVCAIVEQESNWDTWAVNPEPAYRYLWDFQKKQPFRTITPEERASEIPPKDFTAPVGVDRDAEWFCQEMSWGLMQVMGAVARERGFLGKFLTSLCDPATNLDIGCRHFQVKLTSASGNIEDALLKWNGGGNTLYSSQVMARMANYQP